MRKRGWPIKGGVEGAVDEGAAGRYFRLQQKKSGGDSDIAGIDQRHEPANHCLAETGNEIAFMNEMENEMESDPGTEEVRSELHVLQVLLTVMLVMMTGMSICFAYFLDKQIQFQNLQAEQLQMMGDSFPQAAANDFAKRLQDYAKTHPDFKSVTAKYPGVFAPPPAKK